MTKLNDCGKKVEILMTIKGPTRRIVAITDNGLDGASEIKRFMAVEKWITEGQVTKSLHRSGPGMKRAG